jgi:hypothetical protein
MTRTLLSFLFTVIACGISAAAIASCGPTDPTGYYEGTAQSKQAGTLAVSVNLRCQNGNYAGDLATPVGTFKIEGGDFTAGTLHLTFGGGAIPDVGSVALTFQGTVGVGTFRLADDSGTFTISRTGDARAPLSNAPVLALTPQQWLADLRFETTTLDTLHPQPFAFTSSATFDAAITALERRLGSIDGDVAYVGLDHLANLIGDGHTYLEFPPDMALMPLLIGRFGNEYRVEAVSADHEAILGMRVTSIDGIPVAAVHDRFYDLITPVGETEMLRDSRSTNFLNIGMALHGIGVTSRRDVAVYTLASDGGTSRAVSLRALTPAQADMEWTWVGGRPLYRRHPEEDFWFVYLAAYKTVYCSFRGYANLQSNGAALLSLVRENHAEKLVLDLRLNGGGDYKEGLRYLIDPIRAMSSINRRGHLFVLVGQNTFSAAMANAAQFRVATHALLVGQSIGERPNSYQEPHEARLPNSRLLLRYSTLYYEFLPGGPNVIVPDKQILPSWQDVKAGHDPVLDWVLQYR